MIGLKNGEGTIFAIYYTTSCSATGADDAILMKRDSMFFGIRSTGIFIANYTTYCSVTEGAEGPSESAHEENRLQRS